MKLVALWMYSITSKNIQGEVIIKCLGGSDLGGFEPTTLAIHGYFFSTEPDSQVNMHTYIFIHFSSKNTKFT